MSLGKLKKERVHLNLARLKKSGDVFEVDVDPDLAMKFKKGEDVDVHTMIKALNIFKDAQKGLIAPESRLKELFGTTDALEIAKTIIKDGEIQLTSEYRAHLRDQKKRRIIAIIHQNGYDPKTNAPHPMNRIEAAIEEAKAKIDEHKRAEDQVQDVLDAIRVVIPITFAKKEIWLRIDAKYAPKTQGTIRSFGKILEEKWDTDGSWQVTVQIPGGLQEEFYDKINSLTQGHVETKIVKET